MLALPPRWATITRPETRGPRVRTIDCRKDRGIRTAARRRPRERGRASRRAIWASGRGTRISGGLRQGRVCFETFDQGQVTRQVQGRERDGPRSEVAEPVVIRSG
jgi:hypothetical protein